MREMLRERRILELWSEFWKDVEELVRPIFEGLRNNSAAQNKEEGEQGPATDPRAVIMLLVIVAIAIPIVVL